MERSSWLLKYQNFPSSIAHYAFDVLMKLFSDLYLALDTLVKLPLFPCNIIFYFNIFERTRIMVGLLKLGGILYVVVRERNFFKETHCNLIDILNRILIM